MRTQAEQQTSVERTAVSQIRKKKLDDRFENLIRVRDSKLAWILLALFCGLVLVAARWSYWVVGFSSSTLMIHLSNSIVGILVATACLVSVWTSLGQGSLIRRTLFMSCASLAILAAWMLGLTAFFYPESVQSGSREEVYFIGLLPSVFLALSLPLVAARLLFGFVLADLQQESPARTPVTTLGLMTTTALIGCCLGGVRIFSKTVQEESVLIPLSILCGCSFLIGLLLVLPAIFLLCSKRRSYVFWSPIVAVAVSGLVSAAVVGISRATGAWMPSRDVWAIAEGSLVAAITFNIAVGIIRLFGYRLTQEVSRRVGQ